MRAAAALVALALPALAVAAPGWSSAEITPTGNAWGLAVDRAGTARVVYFDIGDQSLDVAPARKLLIRPRARGGDWLAPQPFTLPAGLQPAPNSLPPLGSELIANGRGDLIVEAPSRDRRKVLVAVLRDGTWSTVQAVSSGSEKPFVLLPALAANDAGELVMAWSNAGRIRAATRAADGTWTGPVELAPARPLSPPGVALNEAGDAVVGWSRRTGPDRFAVVAVDRRSGGRWSSPREVVPPLRKRVLLGSLNLDAVGDAVATYEIPTSVDGRSPPIVAAAEHPAGATTWARRTRLGRGYGGVAVMDAAGTAVAAWGPTPPRIAVRPPGGRWHDEGPLPVAKTGPQDLAVTPYGDLVVVAKPDEPRFSFLSVWLRSPGQQTWQRAPADVDGGSFSPGFRLAVGTAGDVLLTYVGGVSNSLNTLVADEYEAPPKPSITRVQAPAGPTPAGGIRLRISLSAPGRALVTISPTGRRRVVGAFFAAVPGAGRTFSVPARVKLVPGRYTVTVDTGGTPLASARRTITLRVTGA